MAGLCASPNQQMFLQAEMTSHTPNLQIKLEDQGLLSQDWSNPVS